MTSILAIATRSEFGERKPLPRLDHARHRRDQLSRSEFGERKPLPREIATSDMISAQGARSGFRERKPLPRRLAAQLDLNDRPRSGFGEREPSPPGSRGCGCGLVGSRSGFGEQAVVTLLSRLRLRVLPRGGFGERKPLPLPLLDRLTERSLLPCAAMLDGSATGSESASRCHLLPPAFEILDAAQMLGYGVFASSSKRGSRCHLPSRWTVRSTQADATGRSVACHSCS